MTGCAALTPACRASWQPQRVAMPLALRRSGPIARRLVDFLSGVAYANNGQIKRVANSTFIITPYNVDIMGDLLDELENNGAFY